MYTGIVQGAFALQQVDTRTGLNTLTIELPTPLLADLQIGASVALDGVCLTVTRIEGNRVCFDVMQETLDLTTLGSFGKGARVNVERSAKQGAEIGGHNISGHVDGTVEVIAIDTPANNHIVTYRAPEAFRKYCFRKGFVGLNGCSLTIADVDKDEGCFQVSFIPETLRVTTHGEKQLGDHINLEIDRQTQVIVDTVEAVMVQMKS